MSKILAFCDYLSHQKRYSDHTIIAYKKDLEQFCRYLLFQYEISDISEATHPIIQSWMVQLLEENTSPRSINRKVSTLKSFFNYLLQKNVVSKNPTLKLARLKTPKSLPTFISEAEVLALFDEIEFPNTYEGIRDNLMLELFYAAGIRLSELVNLQLSDIDIYSSTIKVLGKRNKERIIPISNLLKTKIEAYLIERDKLKSKEEGLFLTKVGKKIYPKLVYRVVKYYLRFVTTASKVSPHVLRHTFATHMLNNGADLNVIKEILGHSSLSATQIYTHNTIKKLKNIHQQAHPKA